MAPPPSRKFGAEVLYEVEPTGLHEGVETAAACRQHPDHGGVDSRGEVLAALAAAQGDLRLCAHLLAYTGVRVASALNLDVTDVRSEQGHRVAIYLSKGGRHGLAVLPQPAAEAIAGYIAGRTSGPLSLGVRGGRWHRSDAWRELGKLASVALPDRPKGLHPHAWRAGFVTIADAAGVSLTDLQEALLHSDIRTTVRYRRARSNLDRHPAIRLAEYLAEDPR